MSRYQVRVTTSSAQMEEIKKKKSRVSFLKSFSSISEQKKNEIVLLQFELALWRCALFFFFF